MLTVNRSEQFTTLPSIVALCGANIEIPAVYPLLRLLANNWTWYANDLLIVV